jgi:serine/threonine-protein kinase RsbW
MSEFFKQTIANNYAELERLMESASGFLEEKGVDAQASYRINLALEEMVTNVIKYGYDAPGEHPIHISVEVREDEVRATIEDDGREFNPLIQEFSEQRGPVEERRVGGLGIHLIKKLLSRLDYRREEGRNIVEVRAVRKLAGTT